MERGPGAGSMSMAGADIRVTAPHISWWPGPVAAAGRLYGGPSVGTWGQGGLWEFGRGGGSWAGKGGSRVAEW